MTKTPSPVSPDETLEMVSVSAGDNSQAAAADRTAKRRFWLALLFCFGPWVAVYIGLYRFGSAMISFLLYHTFCLLAGLFLRSPALPKIDQMPLIRRRVLVGVVILANLGAAILYSQLGNILLDRPRVLNQMQTSGLPPNTYYWLFPYFAIVNPLAEEFFWRGGVYPALRHRLPHWVLAALLTSVFFGGWHWLVVRLFVEPWLAIGSTAMIALVGFMLTVVYERTRRLLYPIALHALAGDMPLLVILWMVSILE
ncbi:MAG: hypothetical protein OHK0029_41450 [Armatimonadaceae bacterium]